MKYDKKRANSIQIKLTEEFMQATLAKDLQNIILPFCNVDMHQHITLQLQIDQPYAQAELQLGPQWKVAPLDELLAKLRDYFGKDNIYIEYQVKSKAAKAAEPARPQTVASPPADMTMDDALDLYQSEVSQYS